MNGSDSAVGGAIDPMLFGIAILFYLSTLVPLAQAPDLPAETLI